MELHELVADVVPVENGYQLLAREKTTGRFPCGLAIAKLQPEEQPPGLRTVEATHTDQAYWVEAFRGVAELRDLQFLRPVSVRPQRAGTETLCAAARAQGADLLLLYAPNRYGPNAAQVLGVLLDAGACRAIATLHASAAFTSAGGVEEAPDRKPGDHRDTDAAFQAARAFEQHALECLAELIRSDQAAPTTQPHQWKTPPEQRWWLYRYRLRG